MSEDQQTTNTEQGEGQSFRQSVSEGGGVGNADFLNSFNEDLRSNPVLQNVKDNNDLANQLINANKLIGKKSSEPSEGTDEDYDKFYDQMGRPKTPDDYEFEKVEGIERTDEQIAQMKAIIHKAGLAPRQAKELMRGLNEVVKTKMGTDTESKKAQEAEFTKIAEETFGGSEGFKQTSAEVITHLKNIVPDNIRADFASLDDKSLLTITYAIKKSMDALKAEDQPLNADGSGDGAGEHLSAVQIDEEQRKLYNDPHFGKPTPQGEALKARWDEIRAMKYKNT